MKTSGFSLIEVLIAVSIIGILSAIIITNFSKVGGQGRDTERAADLKTLQSAIELYKFENDRYPSGCDGDAVWSGQTGSGTYECTNGQYIVGLAPEFIPVLPIDPKLGITNSGYVYITNANGSEYLLVAKDTVETNSITTNECNTGASSHAVWGGYSGVGSHSGCDLAADHPF
jgi:prepilin-type N-terminal cleavage/methylation domain-containing protein